jgi:hypothetical protein
MYKKLTEIFEKMGACSESLSEKYSETCFQKFFYKICSSRIFIFFILTSILVNTVTLSMDRYPIDPKES